MKDDFPHVEGDEHRFVDAAGVRLHVAEAGTGAMRMRKFGARNLQPRRAPQDRAQNGAAQRSSMRAMTSSAPGFDSGSLRLPHFGDCTHDGQPDSHGHSVTSE